ncbi:hydrolase [Amycolatopsis mediterranei S699]|uniref:Hydrolase n=2 Tax=Amycolatopsis mediterranei TaxID=33910 RepID=A0A0H3D9Z2_AMYMU|nr:alpha/beta hydrolase [Amycolatopsis mediterranei]ADJ46893.1 hydrolase [Amycolatopsis mediterranei U32]AEK43701.1 hydrolase [Amycolatopsis mediterranei S699]AFO78604.1 hydrolase [Amycolatopsis mediterranei S699]AGT85732.1 hydrolase [Amycolatopsis mediterranei RB]KDO04674.1 hydrolase [Amycolatopsis mediterranei]
MDYDLLDTGGGDRAVLVLHGGSGPRSVTSIVEHFAPRARVLAPTHPGWSGTPRPDVFTGVDDLALAYLDLLDDEDLADVVVVGSSFGGWVAAELAVRDRGRRVGRLVLLDAIGPEIAGHPLRLPQPPPGAPGPDPADLAALRTYAGPGLADPKLLRRLARVRVPALLLWGEDDVVVPPAFGKAYAAAFPDARFEPVAGAGHLPALQAPERTFDLIDEFLA